MGAGRLAWPAWRVASRCRPQTVLELRPCIHISQFSTRPTPKPASALDFPEETNGGNVICITSGKGGVGKTTTAASFSYGLAQRGYKVCAVDFDLGLRNLDLHMGFERRVVFDFVNVIEEECKLPQALIKDRQLPLLHLLAASMTTDKSALKPEAVQRVMEDLKDMFDFVVCDSPAGIEHGALQAMYNADVAIVCTNPEPSSVRDSDKMVGIINSRSRRAEEGLEPVECYVLITRYEPGKVAEENMLSHMDIEEMLGIPCIGVTPEGPEVLQSTNIGRPVITMDNSNVAEAYTDLVSRFLGEERELRFTQPEPGGLLSMFKNRG